MTFRRGRLIRTGGVCVAAVLLFAIPRSPAAAKDITDKNICSAVENCVFFDRAVPYDAVDVSCDNGIVTLTGEVDNLLAKERGTRLAETVKGVRAVVNRITVKPGGDLSASAIRDNVIEALATDPATDSYEITVGADDAGLVTLSGTVESWREKELTERVARGTSGVTGIKSDIEIAYKSKRSDAEIGPEIRKTLEWDALVDHHLIDVGVNDGKVTLRGTVGSAAEKRKARADAWVIGVHEVDDSELRVHDWAKNDKRRETEFTLRTDEQIRKAVNDANLIDPRVYSFNVQPEVTAAVVTLRGTVDNLKAKHAAAANARNTTGVVRVVNRLKVRPAQDATDTQIAADVRQALKRDPLVDRYQISVSVVDRTAYLTGMVDTFFEKAEAEDAAARVNGVTEVSNMLTVAYPLRPLAYDPYVYDWYVRDYGWYDPARAITTKTDKEIKDDIESELWWSPFVDSDEVSVSVDDGVATLAGTVDSWSERRFAAENAIEGGAIAVKNDLMVRVH